MSKFFHQFQSSSAKGFAASAPIPHNSPCSADDLEVVTESLEEFVLRFRRYYRSGDRKTFREWLGAVSDLLDGAD